MVGRRELFIFSLLICLLVGCSVPGDARPLNFDLALPTETATEQITYLGPRIRSSGKVVLIEEYNLSFPISGQISDVMVDQGDFVEMGETLAKLDTTAILNDIAKSEGELAIAQAKLARVMAGPHKSEIREAEIEVTAVAAQEPADNVEATSQASDLASAEVRLEYLLDLPRPEDVAIAQAEVEQAQKNLDTAKAQLKLTSLIAPTDGTVIRVLLKAHEYAKDGQVVVQMSDLKNLGIETEIYDFEIAGINEGDRTNIKFDALPGTEVIGIVNAILPDETEEQGGKYNVTIRLVEIPKGLRWGMTANVFFNQ